MLWRITAAVAGTALLGGATSSIVAPVTPPGLIASLSRASQAEAKSTNFLCFSSLCMTAFDHSRVDF